MKKFIINVVSMMVFISPLLQGGEYKSSISNITPEIKSRMNYSWKDDSPVPLENLRYITLSHFTFDGEVQEGEIVVHEAIAQDVVDIFSELFKLHYPLMSMKLVDEFGGNDDASMAVNNCYAHCTRKVARENRWSNHAFGLALDINPRINPYVNPGKGMICPPEGKEYYKNRSADIPGMITKDSPIYRLFIEHGFEWGGECFPSYEDLHHFQKVIPGINNTQN